MAKSPSLETLYVALNNIKVALDKGCKSGNFNLEESGQLLNDLTTIAQYVKESFNKSVKPEEQESTEDSDTEDETDSEDAVEVISKESKVI